MSQVFNSEIASAAQGAISEAEMGKQIRTTLRAAFPKAGISVTRHGQHIEWEDSGPTPDAIKAVLVTLSFVETREAWNGVTYLHLAGSTENIWLNCYNVAEREAIQRDIEQRRQEQEETEKRAREAIAQAWQAKRSAMPVVEQRPSSDPPLPPDTDIYKAFERLRQRAEAEGNTHVNQERRPSWAPPLLLGEELAEACLELGWLAKEDKRVGRLWAHFASPKRSHRYARENISLHALPEISCRGFQFYAGSERGSTDALLFEAQRDNNSTWRFGSHSWIHRYCSPRSREWERLISDRETLRHQIATVSFTPDAQADNARRLADLDARIAVIDAADVEDAAAQHARWRLRQYAIDLARTRVFDFAGAPDTQMQDAARLCGRCCRCWKTLTDPLSLERGIGPDCWSGIVDAIRKSGTAGERPETISRSVGMPVEFINLVLSEHRVA
jgi:hypothetical protein